MTINNSINTPQTPWVTYTPTFTGFGTCTNISVFSRRLGDTLQVFGRFTAGTSTATEGRLTLGYNGTSANVSADATIVPSIRFLGLAVVSYVGVNLITILAESGISYMTFGVINAGRAGTDKVNGSTLLASGDSLSFNVSVPVTTWP